MCASELLVIESTLAPSVRVSLCRYNTGQLAQEAVHWREEEGYTEKEEVRARPPAREYQGRFREHFHHCLQGVWVGVARAALSGRPIGELELVCLRALL